MIYLKRLYQSQPGPTVPTSQWLDLEQEGDEPLVRHVHPPERSRTVTADTKEIISFGVYLSGEERELDKGGVDYFASEEGSAEERAYGTACVRLAFERFPVLDEVLEPIREFCQGRLNRAKPGMWLSEIFGLQVWEDLLERFPSAGLLGYSCFVPD